MEREKEVQVPVPVPVEGTAAATTADTAAAAAAPSSSTDDDQQQRRSHQRRWQQTCREKKRAAAKVEAGSKQAAEEKEAHNRQVKATRMKQQRARDARVYKTPDNKSVALDVFIDWISVDLCAQYECAFVRDVAAGLTFELDADANDFDFSSEKVAAFALADKQGWRPSFYWTIAFLVCRNTNASRKEPDGLEGLLVAMRNYPGDRVLLATVIHVLSATVQLVQEMPLSFIEDEQKCTPGCWVADVNEPHWSAGEWKRAVFSRVKYQWTKFVVDFLGTASEGSTDRKHGDTLLAALDEEVSDSDGEEGAFAHPKKKQALSENPSQNPVVQV